MKALSTAILFLWSFSVLAADPLPACALGWGELGKYLEIANDAKGLEKKIATQAKALKLTAKERASLNEAYAPFLKGFSKTEREELLSAFAAIEKQPALVNAATPQEARKTVIKALDQMSEQPCS